ncbi:MAG: response regulator transcription factor [Bacteroidaceae bacterium]|nr:response regulator transcription factor [Bacteroidaceae bacterium]
MIRCIIVDDEPLAVAQLEKYVARVPFLQNVCSCSCASEAAEALEKEIVDVMFVDINMPDMDGVQLVRSLQDPPMVVFTTAYSEYAIEGFRVDAVAYLLKPIGFEDFLKAANKVYEMYSLRKGVQASHAAEEDASHDCLFVKSDYRVLRVPIDSIKYIESMSEYVRIFVEGKAKPIVSLLSMKKIEESLPESSFMRVHRSYLVNLNKVKEVSKMRIVYDGDVYIPIGEMYKEHFFEYIEKRFVGKGK